MTTFAILGAGGMGAALAQRLTSNGAEVLTSLQGRSAASRQRAAETGMKDVSPVELLRAELILSVVPPDQALPLAESFASVLAAGATKPIYVDCNAVSPAKGALIEAAIVKSGAPFADGGIIGLPPRPTNPGPTIYASGPHAPKVAALSAFGVNVGVLDAPNGAASALKMSYAGITKGLIALAATMALASERAGVADAFRAELRKSQSALAQSFAKSVPDMIPKAWRWVPEMHEIADFVSGIPTTDAYKAFAGLYDEIAGMAEEGEKLRGFYTEAPPAS